MATTCELVNLLTRKLTKGVSSISRPSLWGRGRGWDQLHQLRQLHQLGLLFCFF